MRQYKNRKGAVELSLNLIIMLIIGMVILGLVIGFVSNLVNKGTASFDKELSDNEELKLEEVARCSDNLCIIPNPSISVVQGGETNMFIKARAFGDSIDSCASGDLYDCSSFEYTVSDQEGNDISNDEELKILGPGFNIEQGYDQAQMYTLRAEPTIDLGTYYLTLKLYPNSGNTVTKTLTVKVN